MMCHFCHEKPREKPFWIQLGTNGPFVCGGEHYRNPEHLQEIDRVIEFHMGLAASSTARKEKK